MYVCLFGCCEMLLLVMFGSPSFSRVLVIVILFT